MQNLNAKLESLVKAYHPEQAIKELQDVSMKVSIGDVKIILMGCVLSRLSKIGNLPQELATLHEVEHKIDLLAQEIMAN